MTEQPRTKTAAELLAEIGESHESVLQSCLQIARCIEYDRYSEYLEDSDPKRLRYLVAHIQEMEGK